MKFSNRCDELQNASQRSIRNLGEITTGSRRSQKINTVAKKTASEKEKAQQNDLTSDTHN